MKTLFAEPLKLVEEDHDATSGEVKFRVFSEGLQELADKVGNRKVRVICVVGPYRQGKSFIMNELMGHSGPGGFALGHEVDSKTKGLWCWARELTQDEALVVLDTEGLGDVRNPSVTEADIKRFMLGLLLSSSLVYNQLIMLDALTMQRLSFVSDMTERLVTKKNAAEEDGNNYKCYFPHLMFLLRDFSKELTKYGGDSDRYISSILEDVPGQSVAIRSGNAARNFIRSSFKSICCRTLVSPVLRPETELKQLDTETSREVLRPEFVAGLALLLKELLSYERTPLKTINVSGNDKGQVINGRTFAVLVEEYARMISVGVASIPNAYEAIVKVQAEKSIEEAVHIYGKMMADVNLPMEESDLRDLHESASAEAHRHLGESIAAQSLNDAKRRLDMFLNELDGTEKTVGGRYFSLKQRNEALSEETCKARWNTLVKDLEQQVNNRAFKSIDDFNAAREMLERNYDTDAIAKGPKKPSVKADGLVHLSELSGQVAIHLQLSNAEKKLLEQQNALNDETKKNAEMSKELNRQAVEAVRNREEAAIRQKELEQRINDGEIEYKQNMEQLKRDQDEQIKKAQEQNQKELAKSLSRQKDEFEAQMRKQHEETEKKLKEEREKAKREVEDMNKRSACKRPVPVFNPKNGRCTTVVMSDQELRDLGL
jgi:hypothetical protein